jgi:hypothetical protein
MQRDDGVVFLPADECRFQAGRIAEIPDHALDAVRQFALGAAGRLTCRRRRVMGAMMGAKAQQGYALQPAQTRYGSV